MKRFAPRIVVIAVCICAFLYGCSSWLNVKYQKKLKGNYYLLAVDAEEQMSVSMKVSSSSYSTIVDETVYEVGYDSNFIVAIQHPMNNKDISAYYIVKMDSAKVPSANNTFGPLTFQQFYQKKKDLGIEDLGFSLVFNELK